MSIYDKWGFDEDGYNQNGFDKMGFDRDGYDKWGYDIHGYNRQGINKLTGRDYYGFDIEGFDIEGFNRQGYDRDGFNKLGFNCEGFDRKGYNKDGYDKDGYDRNGYNSLGFNREGYDRKGFDRLGYDKEGYSVKGYDRDGYNRQGYDENGFDKNGLDKDGFDIFGFDQNGYDQWGYDRDGYDDAGLNIFGIDQEGYNFIGYDQDGYDREGIHRNGFSKSDFDEDGYHLYTGFNLQGYDREGFNINGVDIEGYDRKGFNIDGFNREGFNSDGYNIKGYDKNGFNIKGYNSLGYDKYGYNENGFDKQGYDREGYDNNGYNREGYDRYGYDKNGKKKKDSVSGLKSGMTVYHKKYGEGKIKRFEDKKKYVVVIYPFTSEEFTYAFPGAFKEYLSIEKPESIKSKESSYSKDEDDTEKKWYSDLARYLRGPYTDIALKNARTNFHPQLFTFINKSGFTETKEIGAGIDGVYDQIRTEIKELIGNPYFSHIDYSENHNLYIGKKEIPGHVTDWADKKASLYYQYQMYIGNAETNLKLVREIDFGAGNYLGYRDLYNAFSFGSTARAKYADERLSKIIMSNQRNKHVHDIIETIQQNQYEIITQNKETNIQVLGCAGSGKTMILMHRIRYIKYNDPEMDMQKVIVISPTDILGKESIELSHILDISAIRQTTMTNLYLGFIANMLKNYYHEENLLDGHQIVLDAPITKLFDEAYLAKCTLTVRKYCDINRDESIKYRKSKVDKIDNCKKNYHQKYGGYRNFQHKFSLFHKAQKELEEYGEDDFIKSLNKCNQTNDKIYVLKREIKIVLLVLSQATIKKSKNAVSEDENFTAKNVTLQYTKALVTKIDIDELFRYIKKNTVFCGSIPRLLQLFYAFKKEECDITRQQLLAARTELQEYSEADLILYINNLEREISNLEKAPRKAEVIQYLLLHKMVKKGKGTKANEQTIEKLGNNLVDFFDEMGWENTQDSPFVDFEMYEELLKKGDRLKGFESGERKWGFLQDILLDVISVSNDEVRYSLNDSHIFAIAYILQRISGYCIADKNFIFIDEFQDFSNSEIGFLKKVMSESVFNLFGDYYQCINPKGITSEKKFKYKDKFITYVINENYRNAKTITRYVNKRFGMNMLGIGLAGGVKERKTIIPEKLEKDDRGAIIVTDNYSGNIMLKDVPVYDFRKEGIIHRNAYNIIPVSMAKGIEFEKVIVITKDMSERQQYVACTRAISHLNVVV